MTEADLRAPAHEKPGFVAGFMDTAGNAMKDRIRRTEIRR